jgi:hypothetical protein
LEAAKPIFIQLKEENTKLQEQVATITSEMETLKVSNVTYPLAAPV